MPLLLEEIERRSEKQSCLVYANEMGMVTRMSRGILLPQVAFFRFMTSKQEDDNIRDWIDWTQGSA